MDPWSVAGGCDTTMTRQRRPREAHSRSIPLSACGSRRIGTVATDRWSTITGGTYRVGDAVDEPAEAFEWRAEWALITVRDPENGERVILVESTIVAVPSDHRHGGAITLAIN